MGADTSRQGPFAVPAVAPPTGALVLLEQHTASNSATLDFTTAISATYDEYVIELINVLPVSGANYLHMVVSTNGGSTWKSSGYSWAQVYVYPTYSGVSANGVDSAIQLAGSNVSATLGGVLGTVHVYAPLSTALYKLFTFDTIYYHDSQNGLLHQNGGAMYNVASDAINALRFLMASGNIASGTIRVYGIAKS